MPGRSERVLVWGVWEGKGNGSSETSLSHSLTLLLVRKNKRPEDEVNKKS